MYMVRDFQSHNRVKQKGLSGFSISRIIKGIECLFLLLSNKHFGPKFGSTQSLGYVN